jgi:hypothetical protein
MISLHTNVPPATEASWQPLVVSSGVFKNLLSGVLKFFF